MGRDTFILLFLKVMYLLGLTVRSRVKRLGKVVPARVMKENE